MNGVRSQQEIFEADLARFNAAFETAGAVRTDPDGTRWIEEAKCPTVGGRLKISLFDSYSRFLAYGRLNGLIP